jgi:hypothetical protein
MKKIFLSILVCFILLTPVVVFAQSTSQPCTAGNSATLCNPIRVSDSLVVYGMRIVQVFTTFFAFFALIYVVYSGFRMVMSQGDSEALAVAKSSFTWAIFGLILGMFAFVLITATGTFIGAQNPNPDTAIGNNPVRNPLMDTTFYELMVRILTGFLSIAGLIAMLMIIIGGYRYITSHGNEELAESGRKTLQWSIAGLIIIALSYVLVRATLTFFGN